MKLVVLAKLELDCIKIQLNFIYLSFCLINKAKKPTSKLLDAETNKILASKSVPICKETGASLYSN